MDARITVDADGTVKYLDAAGQPLPHDWVAKAKRQHGDQIRNLIQECCDKINAQVEALGMLHVHTPAPHERLRYEREEFVIPPTIKPVLKTHGFLGRLFKSARVRTDAENAKLLMDYETDLKVWVTKRAAFEESERARKLLFEERVFSDVDAMEQILEGALKGIEWPRETVISAEVDDGGRVVLLDVDLPEIEDMPKTTASVPSKGYKLTVREMNGKRIQQLYMQHIHGIGFRLIGEAFAVLPTAQEVVLSAFSQRANKATGAVTDEYLYSVRVKREDWAAVNFKNLQGLDVISALERFELRREMSKTGLFKAVEPLTLRALA